MSDAASYWSPLMKLVPQIRCWVRVAWREDDSTVEGRWGQMLIMPVRDCLEASDGPMPLRDVEWVEVSTSRVKGGMAGRPLEFVDVKNEILAGIQETELRWELRECRWSIERVFENEPVEVVHFVNPFGPKPRI